MTKLIGLIYPFTKAKLRRALHFALGLVTVAGVVSVLLSSLGGWQKAQALGLVLAAFVANARVALSKAEAGIDALPIPADDEPAKTPASEEVTKPEKLGKPSPNTPVVK